MTAINLFNQSLVNEDINIIDYVKKINDAFYKIDISFAEELMSLVDKDGFCVHHEMLQKYGVLSEKYNESDVMCVLKQNEMVDGEDYITIPNVSDNASNGTKHGNIYMLHPRTFETCLIRSLKTIKYARYYVFLEEAIRHYSEYGMLRMEKILKEKSSLPIPKPDTKETCDNFVLFRTSNADYPYFVVRGRVINIKKQMMTRNYTDDDILLQLKLPHGVNFFDMVKERIRKKNIHYKFNEVNGKLCRSNEFKLIDISMEKFVDVIRTLHLENFGHH